MTALTFVLKAEPAQRLDLSALTPDRLPALDLGDIAQLELHTTKEVLRVGDLFRIVPGDPRDIRFEGGSERFDRVGHDMMSGTITVEGDVGAQLGRHMAGGEINVLGHAGPWAGSGLKGGRIRIGGSAGDWLAGPLPGELAGMRGGTLLVGGHAGGEAGHRMRRGLIFVAGDAGAYAGRAMIAGTLIVCGAAGALPGYLMRRGTIVLGLAPVLSPTFLDCGPCDLVFIRLLDAALRAEAMSLPQAPLRRLAGDTAVLGKGEILVSEA